MEGLLNEHEVSFWGDDNVLELDGDGCTTWGMSLMPLNYALENGYFYVV